MILNQLDLNERLNKRLEELVTKDFKEFSCNEDIETKEDIEVEESETVNILGITFLESRSFRLAAYKEAMGYCFSYSLKKISEESFLEDLLELYLKKYPKTDIKELTKAKLYAFYHQELRDKLKFEIELKAMLNTGNTLKTITIDKKIIDPIYSSGFCISDDARTKITRMRQKIDGSDFWLQDFRSSLYAVLKSLETGKKRSIKK